MEALRELIHLMSPRRLRAIRMMGFPFSEESNMGMLYHGLYERKFSDDREASRHIFQTDQAGGPFRKLKAGLHNRLVSLIFLQNDSRPAYTDRKSAFQECHKKWAASKMIMALNAKHTAIQMAKQVLKYARQYEFTSLCMDVCKMLKMHFGTLERDHKQYLQYNNLFEEYFQQYKLEIVAENAYINTVNLITQSKLGKTEVIRQLDRIPPKLNPILHQSASYNIQFYGRLSILNILTFKGDIEEALQLCEESITFFEKKTYTAQKPLEAFYYQKLICSIQLKSFPPDQYEQLCRQQPSFFKLGTYNWFKYQEAVVILGLQLKKYALAFDIFSTASQAKALQTLPNDRREYWLILEYYFHFLHQAGKFNWPDVETKKFPIGKFLNQTVHTSKDKGGLNASIKVIEQLHYLQKGRWAKIEAQQEALKQYAYRHLKQPKTLRSFYFFKLLISIPKYHFDQKKIHKNSIKLIQSLKATPLSLDHQSPEVEIIPFEDLWEMILNFIDLK